MSHPGGSSLVAPVPYCPGLMSHAPLISVAFTRAEEGLKPWAGTAAPFVTAVLLACQPSW